SATSGCSGSSCGLLASRASSTAAATASRAFSVYLLMFIRSYQLSAVSCQLRSGVLCSCLLQLLQFLEELSLFRRERARELHVGRGVQVARLGILAGHRHAVSLQPEYLTVLRRDRNLQAQRLAAKRLHVRLAAQHGRRQRNRDARVEVASLPLALLVRRGADAQIEIAGLRAAGALLAFAGDADARAFADARWNADVDGPRLPVVLNRKAPRRAAKDLLERQLEL